MDFRTKIDIPVSDFGITHKSNLMMFGSCFAQNIGNLLADSKFNVNINPFGVLYNPLSVSSVIGRIIKAHPFTEKDLLQNNDLYVSFMHHGDYSALTAKDALNKINASLKKAADDFLNSDILIITFGTAYIYRLKTNGMVVSNCHKFPALDFERTRLSVADIVDEWRVLIHRINRLMPGIKIIFTVSPIRHWKDGAHENQLSKSTLLLAIDALQKQEENLCYFPSYEILMDELRDYRFYADDMIHPSQAAIDYIRQRFAETFFDDETKSVIRQWDAISRALKHRPLNEGSGRHKQFLKQTLLKLEAFQQKYPYLNCEKELSFLKGQL